MGTSSSRAHAFEPTIIRDGIGLRFWCPGCSLAHRVLDIPGLWSFNQNFLEPTLSPAIRIESGEDVCVSYITAGRIEFMAETTHDLRGKTVRMAPFQWGDE